MNNDTDLLKDNLISIATELFRFERVFEKAVSKLELSEQAKYLSQFSWFKKKVNKALEDSNLRIVDLEGKLYDPGMAVTPLNIDEFEEEDQLYVAQTIEPIIMQNDTLYKMGTVILGRIEG